MGKRKWPEMSEDCFYEIIRINVGYGKPFSMDDLSLPLESTTGIRWPTHRSFEDILGELVSRGYAVPVRNGADNEKYLLLRRDNKEGAVVGFNPRLGVR